MIKIPITMCHGVERKPSERFPLPVEYFDELMRIVSDLGFQSINYDQLAAWRAGTGSLPPRPIMLDFDHPVITMRYEVLETLNRYGFRANLFVNTGMLDELYRAPLPPRADREIMTWDELGELVAAGWHIGGHTVTHPNLSQLSPQDPTGEKIRRELLENNAALQKHLGVVPKDFAFTGTSWSSIAEREVAKIYRFGRLWIVGSEYQADGQPIRYADLVGADGPDETDGGPPRSVRYITKDSAPYRLPSMEIQALIHEKQAFRRYLEDALT